MKSILAIPALAIMVTGCSAQSQIDQQTQQLAAINVALTQIQANQTQLIGLQKTQVNMAAESNNLQALQLQRN